MAYLRIANLKKKYRISRTEDQEVLKGLNVEFKRGELVAILGESGCGKSTFMNILGGLDNDYTGSVVYDGQFFKDYSEKQLDDWRKHKVGLIFQNYNLISHMTVAENIEIAMTMTRQSKAKRQKRVDSLLKKMGLDGMEGKLPNQLSGGQRQRVAIARAIANNIYNRTYATAESLVGQTLTVTFSGAKTQFVISGVYAIMIFIVTYISVIERTKEIGILRAVGGRRKDVTALFVLESLLLGAIAGLAAIRKLKKLDIE